MTATMDSLTKAAQGLLITVGYSPELGVYTMSNGRSERIVRPEELGPGGKYSSCRSIFDQAKAAVESGKAIHGVSVEL